MCNCGQDELDQAERLGKRMRSALVAVMCLVALEIGTRSNAAVVLACVAVQFVFLGAAVWLFVRRRTVLCGEVR